MRRQTRSSGRRGGQRPQSPGTRSTALATSATAGGSGSMPTASVSVTVAPARQRPPSLGQSTTLPGGGGLAQASERGAAPGLAAAGRARAPGWAARAARPARRARASSGAAGANNLATAGTPPRVPTALSTSPQGQLKIEAGRLQGGPAARRWGAGPGGAQRRTAQRSASSLGPWRRRGRLPSRRNADTSTQRSALLSLAPARRSWATSAASSD